MMKNNNKILAILFILGICFACSDKADTTTPTATQPKDQEHTPTEPKQAEPTTAVQENTFTHLKPKQCDLYFAKDAVEKAQQNENGVYLNQRRSVFVGDEGILLTNLMYKEKKLQIAVNFFYVGREVCISDYSPLFVAFKDDQIHSITGLQKGNCASVKDKSEVGAIGMYHLPINSALFKRLLFGLPTSISVQMKNDVGVFKPYDESNAEDFRNAIRCAYEVLGPGIDMNNEKIIVDTVIHKAKY